MSIIGGVDITDNTVEMLEAIKLLTETEILVGVPSDDDQPHFGGGTIAPNARTDTPINNATIGYIQETGAPEINLPARPHLVPGVQGASTDIAKRLEDAAQAAFKGQTATVEKNFHAAGLIAQSAVRAVIAAKIPPPLAPRTIAARLAKSNLSAADKAKLTSADFTPLIDTGQYINSISYVLRKTK